MHWIIYQRLSEKAMQVYSTIKSNEWCTMIRILCDCRNIFGFMGLFGYMQIWLGNRNEPKY